jgi:sulfonate transport system substrate-binding protein
VTGKDTPALGFERPTQLWRGVTGRRGRRIALLILTTTLISLAGCSRRGSLENAAAKHVVRIVRVKQMMGLAVLQARGTLDAALAPLGFTVEWPDFPAGPQQLEAMAAGALDIAATAESPAIFAQAAGTDLVYLATTAPNEKAVALLVPRDSTVRSVAELKGRKIAFQKASIGHYLLLRALRAAGLGIDTVQQVNLIPNDASAAFAQGSVDAWFIWEPFVTRTVQNRIGRVLIDGAVIKDTGNFYTGRRAFVREHPEVVRVFLEQLEEAETWATSHPKEMAELLSQVMAMDVSTLTDMHAKYTYGLLPITDHVMQVQQQVADLWFELGFLPRKIVAREGLVTLEEYRGFLPPGLATFERRSSP